MKQPETAQAAKSAIREEARRHRDGLDLAARASASAAIARHAIALVEKVRPRVMAAYHAIRSEADPRAIIDWAHRSGVACALPAVQDAHTLVFRRYRAGDVLTGGGFDTSAPTNAAEVLPALSLVVTLNANGLPAAFVGVPLIAPVPALSANPGGSDPALTVQLL